LKLRVFDPWSYICFWDTGEYGLRILIGINGASGVVYGIRLLQVLADTKGIETHLIVTPAGEQTIEIETKYKANEIKALARYSYRVDDIGASPASGSFRHDGMIIAPCSMKTLSALAHSYADNLLTRAADVALKERRRLLLLVRETPLHLGHLRNMVAVTEMGAIIMPPFPAFYHKPHTIEDIIDHTVGKALDLLDIEHNLFKRWSGGGDSL
jgi:4-hydroxy-3-polyprenylbenzoate decarboxylase